ncbi:MAG: PP2C family protein-serine/threonine phosphatase [Candidatus Promineifilaceae bacterium]
MKTGTTSIFQSIFRELDGEALDTLRMVAEMKDYPAQTILCQQGAVEHTFYIIVDGRVAITQDLEDGQERLLGVLGPREYFGELGLMDDTPRIANCVAITPVKVLEITEEVFDKVLQNSPPVAYTLMRHVLEMLRSNDRLAIADLTTKNEELSDAYNDLQAAQEEIVEKERIEHELEIAADLQSSLLPDDLPEFDDYRFAAMIQPARVVGGDFYDAFALDDEHAAFLLADVADKSIQAALFMAVARTLFMVESRRSKHPAEVATAVHRGVIEIAPSADIFVTAFYGVLERATGKLTYVVAGHERPLLVRPGDGVHALDGNGRFLGMIKHLELEEFTLDLKPRDRLVLFSDGVPDATNKDGDQYGYQRLIEILKANQDLSAQKLVDTIVADVKSWRGPSPAFDDLTLLILESLDIHGTESRT